MPGWKCKQDILDAPEWWPENPYPKDVFPMTTEEYVQTIPDPQERTALSGCLGRLFWGIASKSIHKAWLQNNRDLAEAVVQFLDWSGWLDHGEQAQSVQIVAKNGHSYECDTKTFERLEDALTRNFPDWKSWNRN